jgi:GGDEF domain-containing protein
MASEIRKGGGDEAELTNYLVEYIETSAGRMIQETEADTPQDEDQVKKIVSGIESDLLSQLSRLNVNEEALVRMEKRLNERMETIMDSMRLEWLQGQPAGQSDPAIAAPAPTVLETLENNVIDDEELEDILKIVRGMADAGEIDENNYSQIHAEISRQKQLLKSGGGAGQLTGEVLNSDELFSLLRKEIARNKRYSQSFCVLGFMIVSAQLKDKSAEDQVSTDRITNTALEVLLDSIREVDSIGRIGKNKIVVVLPTLEAANAKKALERLLRLFHAQPMNVDGIDMQLRVAGVATEYDSQQAPDAASFAKQVVNQLTDMATRVKNIQVLF